MATVSTALLTSARRVFISSPSGAPEARHVCSYSLQNLNTVVSPFLLEFEQQLFQQHRFTECLMRALCIAVHIFMCISV
jgi:hypothetical protein